MALLSEFLFFLPFRGSFLKNQKKSISLQKYPFVPKNTSSHKYGYKN